MFRVATAAILGWHPLESTHLTWTLAQRICQPRDRDPTGTAEVARGITSLIPNARLEVLPAGHVPWLGNADRVAELLSRFIRSNDEG